MSNDDNRDHDHDRNRDRDPEGKQVAPAPTGGAIASLKALETAFAAVPTAPYIGRTGRPMLLFKSREGSGTWRFGQKRMIPEDGSRWAVNPLTFKWGWISFADNKKVAGEEMVSVTQPKPDFAKLPDTGFPWTEQWSVEMKCLDGADAGIEVTHKANTDGTRSAIVALFDQVRSQVISEQQAGKKLHDSKIVAIILLEKDSYPHAKHGPISIPVLNLVDWMTLDGPTPAPTPEPAPTSGPTSSATEQPRRRRVA